MLGAGYLLTGDYFKTSSPTNEVRDNYPIVNKLTLTFYGCIEKLLKQR
jgi:hypothetical protein